MAPRIGYLLPTREQIMDGRPEAASLLALATLAGGGGLDAEYLCRFPIGQSLRVPHDQDLAIGVRNAGQGLANSPRRLALVQMLARRRTGRR